MVHDRIQRPAARALAAEEFVRFADLVALDFYGATTTYRELGDQVVRMANVLLGPGVLGRAYPEYYNFVFNPQVVQALNGIAWWAVMIFVMIAGIELDLKKAWEHRRESSITAALALGVPLVTSCVAALGLLGYAGWQGAAAQSWQFVLGVGMACAVTALPILILLM